MRIFAKKQKWRKKREPFSPKRNKKGGGRLHLFLLLRCCSLERRSCLLARFASQSKARKKAELEKKAKESKKRGGGTPATSEPWRSGRLHLLRLLDRSARLSFSRIPPREHVFAVAEPVVVNESGISTAVPPSFSIGAGLALVPVAAGGLVARLGAAWVVPAWPTIGRALLERVLELRQRAPVCRKPFLPVVVWSVL